MHDLLSSRLYPYSHLRQTLHDSPSHTTCFDLLLALLAVYENTMHRKHSNRRFLLPHSQLLFFGLPVLFTASIVLPFVHLAKFHTITYRLDGDESLRFE